MRIDEVARVLGVSKKYIYVNHDKGEMCPRPLKLGQQLRWRPEDVRSFIDDRPRS